MGTIVAPAAVSKVTLPVGEAITTLVIAPLLFRVSVKEDAAVSTPAGVGVMLLTGTFVQLASWLMPGTITVEPLVTADQLVKGVAAGVAGVVGVGVDVVGTVPPPPPPHADKNMETIAAVRAFC
jgi:hypothetical protein